MELLSTIHTDQQTLIESILKGKRIDPDTGEGISWIRGTKAELEHIVFTEDIDWS